MDGFELSTDKRDVAAPGRCDLTRVIFIRFRGPKALEGQMEITARSPGGWHSRRCRLKWRRRSFNTGVRKEGPAEAGPSCHELKPDLLVISISCADRSTDLAAWGASAVHIDVGGSFTHRLHDFCKVRAGRNALAVGSNYIGRCNRAGYCAGGGVRARRRIWKAGRRSASSTCSGATEKYHNPDFFGEAKM